MYCIGNTIMNSGNRLILKCPTFDSHRKRNASISSLLALVNCNCKSIISEIKLGSELALTVIFVADRQQVLVNNTISSMKIS